MVAISGKPVKEVFKMRNSNQIDSKFVFNAIGELVATPASYTLADLERVHAKLINEGQYISASRIAHLIQVCIHQKDAQQQ